MAKKPETGIKYEPHADYKAKTSGNVSYCSKSGESTWFVSEMPAPVAEEILHVSCKVETIAGTPTVEYGLVAITESGTTVSFRPEDFECNKDEPCVKQDKETDSQES